MLNNVNVNGGMRQADNCCNQRTFFAPNVSNKHDDIIKLVLIFYV